MVVMGFVLRSGLRISRFWDILVIVELLGRRVKKGATEDEWYQQ